MRVQLVGAGPGPADLMTVRAARAVQQAEALLYDALVCDEVLAMAPARCVRIRTGKRAGKASMRQDTINRLMLRLARRGLRVVRLKGGDPSVFGRCGEERDFLEAHGVEVEVVPGVTAASAAAAQFAFPLTHRGEARRLMLATARTLDGDVAEGWCEAADHQTTVALYMAGQSAGDVATRLIAEGRPRSTPALAVENAGRPEARLVRCDLADLGEAVSGAAFTGPVLLLVGAVAARARKTGAVELTGLPAPARACR
ncbi:MAG TPA: uroporphyrinogen-III C-methyltransferase [Candidatus Limnocylindria bacterium]|nr:uroporphyrinogen-III C-methyltransferase [Candidatus Limnocylindria bacterium]